LVPLDLEKAEEPERLLVELDVRPIHDRGDPAHHPVTAPGEEILYAGVLMEGVLVPPQHRHEVGTERRDPVRIPGVDPPGQIDETPQVSPATHRLDPHRGARPAAPRPTAHRRPGARSRHTHITAMRRPTWANASSTKSICSSLCVAISEIRRRHEFSGTAGGMTGFVNTPRSNSSSQRMNVCSPCPISTGITGVSLRPMS